MSPSGLEAELLALAERAARAAGAELTKRRGGELTVHTKSTDTDPVSEADIAAEGAIRQVLAAERPGDAILGEEGGHSAGESGLRWIVDPLDGTVNYLYGLPAFVVSVACEDADGGLVGVVFDPVRDVLYSATRQGPAMCGERELACSTVTELGHALIATGFAYDAGVRAVQGRLVGELLPQIRDIRRVGAAALDLAWCAAGRFDAYFERGVKPWDIAAGTLLCRRAGLSVRHLPELPGNGEDPALPDGVLVAPPALVDQLYALVG